MKDFTRQDLHDMIDSCPEHYSTDRVVLFILGTLLRTRDRYFLLDAFKISSEAMSNHILNCMGRNRTIKERATWLEAYLKGEMYKEDTEEYKEHEEEYRELQIGHVELIKEYAALNLNECEGDGF